MTQRQETKYTPILMAVAAIVAIALSLAISNTLHTFAHRKVFSPPNESVAETAPVEAPAHNDSNKPLNESVAEVALTAAPAHTFNDLLDAIEMEESGGDANAKGDYSSMPCPDGIDGCLVLHGEYRAIGSFQIWPIYVDEVNRICGLQQLTERFTYEDRLGRVRSRRMSLIHNQYWADFATMATDMDYDEAFVRSHQGAFGYKSESTKAYWLRVKARMEKVRIVE